MVLLAALEVVAAVLIMVRLVRVEHPHQVKGLLVETVLFRELLVAVVAVAVLLL
jgi:hypothetical protein